jgi:hypothetical protein
MNADRKENQGRQWTRFTGLTNFALNDSINHHGLVLALKRDVFESD